MEQNGIWSEEFLIRAFMIDKERRITLPSIANFLQEVAGNHANSRGIGYEDMQAANRFWALNRLKIEMIKFPMWQETIKICTWVDIMKGPFSYRNFEIYNSENELLGTATTLWLSIDITKRRPARIIETTLPILEGKTAACGHPSKLPKVAPTNDPFIHTVVYSDLDMIGHVNNVKYLEWIINAYGLPNADTYPYAVEINYIHETHYGDVAAIHTTQQDATTYRHSITTGDKELTRAILKWTLINDDK